MAARFGIWLGSRVDLLPGVDCLRLLEITDRAAASPLERVVAFLERQLGGRPEELFEAFEPEPFDSDLLFQRHAARRRGGGAVTVELLHPELETELAPARLRGLVERLISAGALPAGALAAVDEFTARLDRDRAAGDLAELAVETEGLARIEVPEVHRDLCTPLVLVTAATTGRAPAAAAAGEDVREARARRLARLWFALPLDGYLFPAEPWGANLAYPAGGRVVFQGGPNGRLPRRFQAPLREYLAAVAARQPARAAIAFLELLAEGRGDRRLRDRLRHVDPFRDRGWDVGGDPFARQVLAHWRTAEELGYRPAPGLAPFYRGLFLLNQEVRRLAGDDSTAVRDGLREARLLLLAGELGEGGPAGGWAGVLERQIDLLSGLPWKLDRLLTLAAAEERPRRRRRAGGEPRRRGGGVAVVACLLAVTAVVLLSHQLAQTGAAAAEPLGAVLVLLFGGLALRAAAGGGG